MLVYSLVFFLLIVLAAGYSRLARVLNIVDVPNERSSHSLPVIRGGGILFFCAAFLFFLESEFSYPSFFIGLSILAVLSFADDIISLTAKLRLPFQFLAIFFILHSFYLDTTITPLWAMAIISVIGVGFINIYNFMDGINGITGMYSLAVLQGFWLLSLQQDNFIDSNLPIFTVLALLVFGYFNFRPKAKFFAGDVGSVSVAAIILFIGLKFWESTESPLLLCLVGVYGIDSGFTILRRLLKKENIFNPHRHHLYQNLVDKKKFSHLRVSLGYALVQVLVNCLVYFFFSFSLSIQYLFCLILLGGLSAFYFALLKWAQSEKISAAPDSELLLEKP